MNDPSLETHGGQRRYTLQEEGKFWAFVKEAELSRAEWKRAMLKWLKPAAEYTGNIWEFWL